MEWTFGKHDEAGKQDQRTANQKVGDRTRLFEEGRLIKWAN
jgi:hypothetical protein